MEDVCSQDPLVGSKARLSFAVKDWPSLLVRARWVVRPPSKACRICFCEVAPRFSSPSSGTHYKTTVSLVKDRDKT